MDKILLIPRAISIIGEIYIIISMVLMMAASAILRFWNSKALVITSCGAMCFCE